MALDEAKVVWPWLEQGCYVLGYEGSREEASCRVEVEELEMAAAFMFEVSLGWVESAGRGCILG